MGEDDWLAADLLADPRSELVDRGGLVEHPTEADPGKRFGWVDPELPREQRVVPDLGMGVECQVVRRQRHVGVEERLEPAPDGVVDHARVSIPQQPVVDQEHLGAGACGALEELERGRDAAREAADLLGARDLQPHRAVVGEGV